MGNVMVAESRSSTGAERHLQPGHASSRATRIVVGILGILVGLAGIEHGLGEILQGSIRPEALVIESWPDARAMEILQGEPAMTVVPNLLLTGILAIAVALAFSVWTIGFVNRPHAGLILAFISMLLLLVGGGLAPPLLGLIIAAGAAHRTSSRHPGTISRALGRIWPWLLGAAVGAYLGLVPGTVLFSYFAGVESAGLTFSLTAIAFSGAALSLVGARALDRDQLRRSIPS